MSTVVTALLGVTEPRHGQVGAGVGELGGGDVHLHRAHDDGGHGVGLVDSDPAGEKNS